MYLKFTNEQHPPKRNERSTLSDDQISSNPVEIVACEWNETHKREVHDISSSHENLMRTHENDLECLIRFLLVSHQFLVWFYPFLSCLICSHRVPCVSHAVGRWEDQKGNDDDTTAERELVPFGWVLNIIKTTAECAQPNHIRVKLRSAARLAVCEEHGVIHLLTTVYPWCVICCDDVDSRSSFGGNGSYCTPSDCSWHWLLSTTTLHCTVPTEGQYPLLRVTRGHRDAYMNIYLYEWSYYGRRFV